jgi:hypothetical protein
MGLFDASLRNRLNVIAAVIIAYAGALFPFLVFGAEGFWWIKLLFLAGLPFLALAIIFAAAMAGLIVHHPWRWSLAASSIAIVVSVGGLWFLTKSLVGIVSVVPALLAPVVFRVALYALSGSSSR